MIKRIVISLSSILLGILVIILFIPSLILSLIELLTVPWIFYIITEKNTKYYVDYLLIIEEIVYYNWKDKEDILGLPTLCCYPINLMVKINNKLIEIW